MSDLTPELAPEVVSNSQECAEETGGSLTRSLDAEFTFAVGEAGSYSADSAPDGFDGPGLAMMMKFGDVGAAAIIPESTGLLPDWYVNPDLSGEGKLSTLAQELSMLTFPESVFAEEFTAAHVENVKEALTNGKVADNAATVAYELGANDKTGQMTLIWPLEAPKDLISQSASDETPAEEPQAEAPPAPQAAPADSPGAKPRPKITDYGQLPGYAQSLLRIELPVRVVLASKKENLHSIVEMASGSIIKFEKACDEMLHLQIGEHKVAVGEAVKVGDKFGFRVSSMVLPDEHFMKVRANQAG